MSTDGKFPRLVNVTSIAEAEQRRLISKVQADRKRGFPYSSGSNMGKRKAPVTPSKGKGMVVGKAAPITPPPCRQCGKRHSGECRRASGACFRCGQTSHIIQDCSQITTGGVSTPNAKPKTAAKAKVYAITPGEADLEADETANAGVITGKVRLKQYVVCALFHSGASRSFISNRCVRRCELKVELMSRKVLVAIPDGKHYAEKDCQRCEVVFNLPACERICYMGEFGRLDLFTVMAEQVKKSLVIGDEVNLVMIRDIKEGLEGIQGIPMIEDFPKDFADELPGLPPERETEFVIELESATAPI
ncbi:uncharacterized protein LOC121235418 [Juglans microcarpa x Juglans regia]|uniref:uncharacterized protein LOC121235418 n=1 Tax=Juglans microcarpa x Juglans regia TaxID=2249226 RepID=UPI001B7F2378|nr:uncharacterized protein LOC121235418 [Juglans microcarpa x Juglans regia]